MSLIEQKIVDLAPHLKLDMALDRVYAYRMRQFGKDAFSVIENDPELFLNKMKAWVSARSMIRSVKIENKAEQVLAKDFICRILRNSESSSGIAEKFIKLFEAVPSKSFPLAVIKTLREDFPTESSKRELRIISGLLEAFAIRGDCVHFESTLTDFSHKNFISVAALEAIKGDGRRYEISEQTGLRVCKLAKNTPSFDRMTLGLFSNRDKSAVFLAQLSYSLNHSFPVDKAHQMLLIGFDLYTQSSLNGNEKFLFEMKNLFCSKPNMRSGLMKIEEGKLIQAIEELELKRAN
jgi:hypothetical protein